jgi:hypothetical protein
MTQTLIIGKHNLELFIDREFEGVSLEEWTPASPAVINNKGGNGWIFWLLVIIFIFIISR